MNDESLPEIAILGAGPVGIEAALYARFLGFPVTVFELGDICKNVLDWGHVTLFTPFDMNSSSLGLSALRAQDEEFETPGSDQFHTGRQWAEQYLIPLSKTDLLRNSIRTQTRILQISRDGQLPTDYIGDSLRQNTPLRILFEDAAENQHSALFDVVIDCTGTWNHPNWIGSGGGPAVGESQVRRMVIDGLLPKGTIYESRTLAPEQLTQASGSRFVLAGNGYTAATNLMLLESARTEFPDLQCIWLTRKSGDGARPLTTIPDDPLPARRELVESVNEMVESAEWLDWQPNSTVDSIALVGNQFDLRISGKDQVISCDHVLANVGFHGDFEMLESLQLHRCYASGGPMNWAVSIANSGADCLKQSSAGTAAVTTTEPGFFVIGSKSYGRDSRFLFATGLQQIRDVFRVIVDRESLDLYNAFQPAESVNS